MTQPAGGRPQGEMGRLLALADQGGLRHLDVQFARYLLQTEPEPCGALAIAAALVSYELGQGNVCLDLCRAAHSGCWSGVDSGLRPTLPESGAWVAALAKCQAVGDGGAGRPLVLEGTRLYFNRYWHYEQAVAAALQRRSQPLPVNKRALQESLQRLFARDYEALLAVLRQAPSEREVRRLIEQRLHIEREPLLSWERILKAVAEATSAQDLAVLDELVPAQACLDWQQLAALIAVGRRFAVISGGPGTGKTTTVTRLLALVVEQQLAQGASHPAGRVPLIKLVAPTGKAAARLTESIGQAKQALSASDEVLAAIPGEAQTLHRLLGTVPGRRGFRHHRDNPLHLDLLVVDEASMVDLPLMARLLDALPDSARLILLGDKDQLASVEAGSVLGDLCTGASGYSSVLIDELEALTGFDLQAYAEPQRPAVQDGFCLLRRSFRFDAKSGIGALASAVNSGDLARLETVWTGEFSDIQRHELGADSYRRLLRGCLEAYRPYLTAVRQGEGARQVLALFGDAQLLCALRDGPFGVSGLNAQIAATLKQAGLIDATEGWYAGRPVMVTRNDYALELFNGDIGIALPDPESGGALRIFFELPDKRIRKLLPSRMPEHETVFAMTVHKSQGSEFRHCLMVLPPEINPVVTRELVYTGITRAKSRLDLFARDAVLQQAVRTPTQRVSGLADRLWG